VRDPQATDSIACRIGTADLLSGRGCDGTQIGHSGAPFTGNQQFMIAAQLGGTGALQALAFGDAFGGF
jgi:hypothetical protein